MRHLLLLEIILATEFLYVPQVNAKFVLIASYVVHIWIFISVEMKIMYIKSPFVNSDLSVNKMFSTKWGSSLCHFKIHVQKFALLA